MKESDRLQSMGSERVEYLFMVALLQGVSLVMAHRLLIGVSSLVVEPRLYGGWASVVVAPRL